jgi:hypothetical protein
VGHGWFVDPTPNDDDEFTEPGDQGEAERMDLLTAVMHELGHWFELEHQVDGVMAETLAPGTRSAHCEIDPEALDRLLAEGRLP